MAASAGPRCGVENHGAAGGPFLWLPQYARDVIELLQRMCTSATEGTPGWSYGEFWGLDAQRGYLARSEIYVFSSTLQERDARFVEAYRTLTAQLTFPLHGDVFGMFLSSRGMLYEPDMWPRAPHLPAPAVGHTVIGSDALMCNFRSLLAVPLYAADGAQLVGAIVFLGFDARHGSPPCASIPTAILTRLCVQSPASLERCVNPVFTKRLLEPFAGSGVAGMTSAGGSGGASAGPGGAAGVGAPFPPGPPAPGPGAGRPSRQSPPPKGPHGAGVGADPRRFANLPRANSSRSASPVDGRRGQALSPPKTLTPAQLQPAVTRGAQLPPMQALAGPRLVLPQFDSGADHFQFFDPSFAFEDPGPFSPPAPTPVWHHLLPAGADAFA